MQTEQEAGRYSDRLHLVAKFWACIMLYIYTGFDMPTIRYKLNYGFRTLDDKPDDDVPILTRSGERKFFRWLGVIDVNVAKQLLGARPVKLDVTAISTQTPFLGRWDHLTDGETVQGCLVPCGVYGVTHSIMPKVIDVKRNLSR